MKRLIVLASILMLPSLTNALDMNYIEYESTFKGSITNTTISLSSETVTTITPTSNYEEISISSQTAAYFFRADGTTTNVQTTGFPVAPGVVITVQTIKGNPVALQFGAGASDATARVLIVRPK